MVTNGWDFSVFPCLPDAYNKDAVCSPVYWDGIDCNGLVIEISNDVKAGLGVVVLTEDKDGIFKHIFWHLSQIKCQVGQTLSSGDLIGLAGNTGLSTGAHLHRGLKPKIRQADGTLVNQFPSNGYDGAIDLTPYYQDIYVYDYVQSLKQQIGIIQKLLDLWKLIKGRIGL